jgi:hypothetical protein
MLYTSGEALEGVGRNYVEREYFTLYVKIKLLKINELTMALRVYVIRVRERGSRDPF